MLDLVISFFNCCPAGAETVFTVAAPEEVSLYRVDQERLRHAVNLIITVVNRLHQAVRRIVRKIFRDSFLSPFPAGRRLINWICKFRF